MQELIFPKDVMLNIAGMGERWWTFTSLKCICSLSIVKLSKC